MRPWINYPSEFCYQHPAVFLHDQEPLNFSLYQSVDHQMLDYEKKYNVTPNLRMQATFIRNMFSNLNLNTIPFCYHGNIIFDQSILLHSEKNSLALEQYRRSGFIPVHYWCHAVIARDWYRYAEVDNRLDQPRNRQKEFLIYCRDWSNTREYRLKFLELISNAGLMEQSQVSVRHQNSDGVGFEQYQFCNAELQVTNFDALYNIPDNNLPSSSSADYVPEDYTNTGVSVILETEFDGYRQHLTEKTLRPIACGQPFLLAAGPGSLEYLRSYGFKTFAPWIDESYDLETNSLARLHMLVSAMKQITKLSEIERQHCQNIADYNREWFFSKDFFNLIKNELSQNLQQGFSEVYKTRGYNYLKLTNKIKHTPEFKNNEVHRYWRGTLARQLRKLRKFD